MLPWKNCQVAQAESWRSSPGLGREASFSDSHTGACVPQRFICKGESTGRVTTCSEGLLTLHLTEGAYYTTIRGSAPSSASYLHAAGWHLCRLVVDLEAVPVWQQRVVAHQVLDRRVLDLCGVKLDAAVGVTQRTVTSGETLWS